VVRRLFYPAGLPARRELACAARRFSAIEINASFLPPPVPLHLCALETDGTRRIPVRGEGKSLHHDNKKLRDVDAPLANLLGSGLLQLGEKLGPILWQLSDALRFDAELLVTFLDRLPASAGEAARLAEAHDARLRHPPAPPPDPRRRLRHVLEVRHPSFSDPKFVRILRDRNVGLVVSDSPDWPLWEEVTSGVAYIRLHGSRDRFASRYTDVELDRWAERIRAWSRGTEPGDAARITERGLPRRKGFDVYVFFDNDAKVHAPATPGG
jgi:uncharacterized protein YecE (DUF72 family)